MVLVALPATASAIHNQSMNVAQVINGSGTPLASFSLSHTNAGDLAYHTGEPTQCNAAGTQYFGSTVWYRIHPHRNGRLRVVAQATGGNLEPVVAVLAYNGGGTFPGEITSGVCNGSTPPINRATLPAEGFLQDPVFPISAGRGYLIAVGGATENNDPPPEETLPGSPGDPATEGSFDLTMVYDPDTDGDSIFDSEDDCDGEGGSAAHRGCPDSDGDGIRNPDDACPTAAGGGTFQGCPDADGDNVPENGQDKCPGVNPNSVDRNDRRPRDGCPDILRNDRQVGVRMNVGGLTTGILLRSFIVTGVPKGARVIVTCKLPNGRRCGGVRVRRAATASVLAKAARRVPVKSLKNKRLPFGTKITVRVTARYATGKYIQLKVVNTDARIKRIDRCMRPGSNRLRKKGCA